MALVAGSRRPQPGDPRVGDVPALPTPELDVHELTRMRNPGTFRAWWSLPGDGGAGPTMAFSGTMELDWDRRLRRYVCTVQESGHLFRGAADTAHGAFIAMLADRCGLQVDNIRIKPEESCEDDRG